MLSVSENPLSLTTSDGSNICHSVYLQLKLNLYTELGLHSRDWCGKLHQLAGWFFYSVSFRDNIKPLDEFESRNVPSHIKLIRTIKLR